MVGKLILFNSLMWRLKFKQESPYKKITKTKSNPNDCTGSPGKSHQGAASRIGVKTE